MKDQAVWDQAEKQSEEEARLSQAELKERFASTVISTLKPFVDAAPGWIKEIKDYSLTANRMIQKVSKTRFINDQIVGRDCYQLQQLMQNPQSIQTGLDRFKELTPQSLLRRLPDGATMLDVNVAANLVASIAPLLAVGRGCRGAMEELVQNIEGRVSFLMERGEYAQSLMPQVPKPETVAINAPSPQSAPDKDEVWDPRFPTN